MILTTYRYKIHARLRIIVAFQADAAVVMDEGIVGHGNFIFDNIFLSHLLPSSPPPSLSTQLSFSDNAEYPHNSTYVLSCLSVISVRVGNLRCRNSTLL